MSEEKPFTKPVPFQAWGEKPGRGKRPAPDPRSPPGEETALAVPAASAEGAENLAAEREALSFVRSFVQTNEQDFAQKMRFLEQLRLLCKAKTVDGFRFFPSDLLIQVVEVLMPWTASGDALERERAARMLARICRAVRMLHGYQDTTEFPVMGQLVGCLALCHFDSSEMVAHWAVDGLCHLYAFAARCQGKSPAEQDNLARFLKRERDGEEEDEEPLKDALVIPLLFKDVLSPEQVSGLYLTALHGLKETHAHKIHAAVCMEKALREDPTVSLGKVPEIVSFLHGHLDSLQDRLAREDAICILHLLKHQELSQVVYTLLSCSPQCDSSAATLWGMLVSRSLYAEEVFRHLMACLQGQPQKPHVTEEEVTILRLAAAHAFPTLLEQPPLGLRLILESRWDTACLSLIFWMSHLHQGVQETTLSHLLGSAEPASERLARSSAGTLHHLLAVYRPEGFPKDPTLWELLGCADTFHRGVSLLFRAMDDLTHEELQQMAGYVMVILNGHDQGQNITALTILAELLRTSDCLASEEALHHLVAQLRPPNAALHSLALDGIVLVADKPQQVWKLLPLLPEAVKGLQESDHPKAQLLFRQLNRCLARVNDPALAAEVAGLMLPLFETEFHMARLFAVKTFGSMLGRGATRALKDLALRSLVPLLLHLHDESPIIIKACWDILLHIAILLEDWKLMRPFLSRDTWPACLITAQRFRKVSGCQFLPQLLEQLRSPQENIREAAVRMLGLLGQETREKRKLEVICAALREMASDEQPSVRSCAVKNIDALEALHETVRPRWSLRDRLRRVFRACCSSAGDG